MNFAIRTIIYSCIFFKKILSDRRLSACPPLLTDASGTLSLPKIPWSVFSTHAYSNKPMFSSFVNIFFTKTSFSEHITHLSVNFTWFAFVSHQKFDDWPLFKPRALWFAAILKNNFRKKKKKLFCFFKRFSTIINIGNFLKKQNSFFFFFFQKFFYKSALFVIVFYQKIIFSK